MMYRYKKIKASKDVASKSNDEMRAILGAAHISRVGSGEVVENSGVAENDDEELEGKEARKLRKAKKAAKKRKREAEEES